jgi:hypothetical protein
MTFTEQIYITLIDKLAIGVFVILAGFWINRALKDFEGKQALRRELELSQNRAALAQLEAQIKELYSPLYGLIQRSQEIFDVAKAKVPLSAAGQPDEEEAPIWRYFVESYFLPLNEKMADLIQSRMYLIEEDEIPESWKLFLEHQTQFHVLHTLWNDKNIHTPGITGKGWPSQFGPDVRKSLSRLRSEYNMFARRLKLPMAQVNEHKDLLTDDYPRTAERKTRGKAAA